VRYISKTESKRRRWLDLATAIDCHKAINDCEEPDAIRDIKAAVFDRKIPCKFEDQKEQPRDWKLPFQWVPPISDMVPEVWKLDRKKRLKDTTGRFRPFLLLKSAFDRCFKEQDLPEPPESLRQAPESEIRKAITEAYEDAEAQGRKPPNIRELAGAVQPLLQAKGYTASGLTIQKLGDRPEYKRRRRPPGKTLTGEHRLKQK